MILKKDQKIGNYVVSIVMNNCEPIYTCRAKDNNKKNFFLWIFKKESVDPKVLQIINLKNKTYNLSHPNIISIVDDLSITLDGELYRVLIAPFISGESLDNYLKRQDSSLSVYDSLRIAQKILEALVYLQNQEQPVIVNNINLSSIFFDYSQVPYDIKLWDLRCATYLDKEIPFSENMNVLPFNIYSCVANESLEGTPNLTSDLFSVASIIYQLLFLYPPYLCELNENIKNNKELAIFLKKVRRNKICIPKVNLYEFDYNLADLLIKTISIDCNLRPQNASKMLSIIEKRLNSNLIQNHDNNFNEQEHFESTIKTESSNGVKKDIDVRISKNNVNNQCKILVGNGFVDVAGMTEIKEQLQSDVIDLLKDPVMAQDLGLSLPNGLLFYGPPGCGKTYFAEKFAEELGCKYLYIKCSDIASPYIHGGQSRIAEVFENAKNNTPCLIFFDEIDAMLMDRKYHNNVSESGEVNEFLTQLNNCGKRGIIAIGATNKPDQLDPAVLRAGRLEYKYYIPLPDRQTRAEIFEINLKNRKKSDVIDYYLLADKTEGFISADIKLIVDKAARLVFRAKVGSISMEYLLQAIGISRPSLTSDQLKVYEDLRLKFENY